MCDLLLRGVCVICYCTVCVCVYMCDLLLCGVCVCVCVCDLLLRNVCDLLLRGVWWVLRVNVQEFRK